MYYLMAGILSNIPIPDPSAVTVTMIAREVLTLRELIGERLDGMDKAIEIVAQSAARIPSAAQIDINNLRELMNEKFSGLNHRFTEGQKRNDLQAIEYKDNIKTAFDAADKAIIKTESVVTKTETFLIKQIDLLFQQSQSHGNRIQALESTKAGATENKVDKRADNTLVIATIGVATAVMVAVVAWNHTTPPQAPATPQTIQIQPVQPMK